MRHLLLLSLALSPFAALADPLSLSHTGFVLGNDDAPTRAANAPFQFGLYAGDSGGSPVWTATCTAPVQAGYYAVVLGDGCGTGLTTAILPPDEARWLQVTYDGTVLLPRVRVTLAPGAGTALDAQKLGGVAATGFWQKTDDLMGAKYGATTLGATIGGLVSEGGTYADPAWITSLSGSKVSGGTLGVTNGSNLTNLNASSLSSGTVDAARLPIGTGANTVAAGNDARFTAINAANLTSGTVSYARLPVGTASSTVAAGDDARFVPAGAVMAFNLATCPTGWSSFGAATGRVVVGGGTVGAVHNNASWGGSNLPDQGAMTMYKVPRHMHVLRSSYTAVHSTPVTQVPGAPDFAADGQYHGFHLYPYVNASTVSYADPPLNSGIQTGMTGGQDAANPGLDYSMPYVQLLYCQKN